MDTFFFQSVGFQFGHPRLQYGEQHELTFSCHFKFQFFPFDSHKCRIEFGDLIYKTKNLNLSATIIMRRGYPDITFVDDPVIINDLPFPYEFQLEALPAFEIDVSGGIYSLTGAILTLERKSVGYLMGGYYYPTTAFALLSMISYLIHADIVRFFLLENKNFINSVHQSFNHT